MAQRRMFSLKIVDTDNFLSMPTSTRLLYYDLSMRADDDGFVDSPKKIMKIIGCSEDDYKILCAKQYIIPFDSGVCVIKHWHIHNLIRHDRYNETEYKDEKNSLKKIDNKYVIPNGNQMATQVRLGKVRVGKDREEKETPAPTQPPAPAGCSIFKSKRNSPLTRACGLFKARSWCFQDKDRCELWDIFNWAVKHLKDLGMKETDRQYYPSLQNQVKQRMDKDAERLSKWANKMHAGE